MLSRVAEDVGVRVEPLAVRVGALVAPARRIVVTIEVVVQPGHGVVILPRQAQIAFHRRGRIDLRLAKGFIAGPPDDLAAGVGELPRKARAYLMLRIFQYIAPGLFPADLFD